MLRREPIVDSRDFSKVAWFYEISCRICSTGQVPASKASQIKQMRPGDKVLYLGVGAGEDCLLAARAGVELTCIDLSPAMIDRTRRKLERENLAATLICGDALQHQMPGHYDCVVTNYFLNCFVESQMIVMLEHAITLIRPGGKYLLADVALPGGNLFSRLFNVTYRKTAMLVYWMIGLVPLHRDHDYAACFPQLGIELESTEHFRFCRVGPILFNNIISRKLD